MGVSADLRGGLVGCGYFARNHLLAWRDVPGARIVAVCDRDRSKAEAAASLAGGAGVFSDAAKMMASAPLDFVDIVTGVESHRDLVEKAASHGLAVICQKPLAETLEDAQAMIDACDRAGVPLMVHENFRWQRPILRTVETIREGRIGRPFYARLSFRHATDIYSAQPYLRTAPRLAILDLGIHLLDVARILMGEATRLHCRTQRINPAVTGEDVATIALDHEGDRVSLVDMSFATRSVPDPFPQTILRVEGDDGTVELLEGYRLRISRSGEMEEEDVEPPMPAWGEAHRHLIQDSVIRIQTHWVDCLRSGRSPDTSGADNLKTLRLALAAYDSAETGRAIAIGEERSA